MNRNIQSLLDEHRQRIDREWEDAVKRYVAILQAKLDQFTNNIEAVESLELDAEEYAPIFSEFDELCQKGIRFDPAFALRIAELRQSAHHTDIDTDSDCPDEGLVDDGFGNDTPRFAPEVNSGRLLDEDD
jgi:hypothetical protein